FVAERLFRRPDEVHPQSRLVLDLGADSLDFIDFHFQIERQFGLHLADGEFFDSANRWIDSEGMVRPESLERLREIMPALREVPDDRPVTLGTVLEYLTVETLLLLAEKHLGGQPDGRP